MKVFVKPTFLTKLLEEQLFVYVQNLHTSSIVYDAIVYKSIEADNWFNNHTKRNLMPLTYLKKLYVPLTKNYMFGKNQKNFINKENNLLFVVCNQNESFNFNYIEHESLNLNLKRLLPFSAYKSDKDILDEIITNRFKNGFLSLEKDVFSLLQDALNSNIVVSEYPSLILKPCFEDGKYIQVSNALEFKNFQAKG